MKLLLVGCDFRSTPVGLRERLGFSADDQVRALDAISTRYGCEVVLLSTCNRVEVYLARADDTLELHPELIAEFLAEFHRLARETFETCLHAQGQGEAVRHLFRVAAGLDSLVVGECQIAGQVQRAFEVAHERATAGPILHALFQHARRVSKRVRTETGLTRGQVSVSSVAIAYVQEVFDHFRDKTVLVIGAGKMGELTLRQLHRLQPGRILITNRSPEKARLLAAGCDGSAVPWEQLDDVLARADIVLSTTGAPEPIVSLERYDRIRARRTGGPVVILDIAVPRDFDPRIHDGDRTCLFNIDDLMQTREQTLRDRRKYVAPAEAIVEEEQKRFLSDWARRRHGPVIARLTRDMEAKRKAVVEQLLQRLNGKLTDAERAYVEGAFRLLQNQFLHGPITALTEEPHEGGNHTLLEALRKLFRLHD
jgi:glutamyl-tRNA reductase